MATPRAVLVMIWIFSINACFTIIDSIDLFGFGLHFAYDPGLVNDTAIAANTTAFSGFGIAEAVNAANIFMTLVLGPLKMVPKIMNIIGIVGVMNWVITGAVWILWAIFLVQLATGRLFKVMQ